MSLLILPFVTRVMPVSDYGAASTLSAAAVLVTSLMAAPLTQLIVRAAARNDHDGPSHLRVIAIYCYMCRPPPSGWPQRPLHCSFRRRSACRVRCGRSRSPRSDFSQQPSISRCGWLARGRTFVCSSALTDFAFRHGSFQTRLGRIPATRRTRVGHPDLLSAILSALMAVFGAAAPHPREFATCSVRHTFHTAVGSHTASLWALTALSRPAMAAVSTLQQVGLLSFGLNLATLAGPILAEFNAATLPRYAREVFRAPTHETLVPVRLQLIAALAVPAIVGSGVAIAGRFIFAPEYWLSFQLDRRAPHRTSAYGLYLIPMNYLTQTAGLTKFSSFGLRGRRGSHPDSDPRLWTQGMVPSELFTRPWRGTPRWRPQRRS